jgi:copper homeostasis protein
VESHDNTRKEEEPCRKVGGPLADRRLDRILLEVIACSVEDARNAEAGGADRLEVVRGLDNEGLSPGVELVRSIRRAVSIPLHVMIRPRNAFLGFSAKEIDSMQDELLAYKQLGVDGVVVGFLTRERGIDFKTLKTVLKEAQPLSITLHRAFDHVKDHRRALPDVIGRNVVHRILTSGAASSAVEGQKHVGRSVRTPPAHDGTVDSTKVRHLASVAKTLSEGGFTTSDGEQ